jgi:hypothetical protein
MLSGFLFRSFGCPTRFMSCHYSIYSATVASPLQAAWDESVWQRAEEAKVANFHPASSSHRPVTSVRLLHTNDGIFVRFHVKDRYVLCTRTQYQDSVYRDSCVEFFVQPKSSGGYFNFEINCGGTLHLHFIEDPTRTDDGFVKSTPVSAEYAQSIRIVHSMPKVVFPEEPGPTEWQVGYQIPRAVLEAYVGPLGELRGQVWRANFFKCADESSHPHWASWSPIGEELNFHQPRYFAPIRFVN